MDDHIINELFENPKKLTRSEKEPSVDAQERIGVSNMQVFHDEDGEKYVKYKRAGAIEVHHMNKDGASGKITNQTAFNPAFVSTMMHLVKPDLETGETVRISAVTTDGMVERYHRMAHALVKKHGIPMSVTPIEPHPTENHSRQFYIQPTVNEAVILVQSITRNDLLTEWSMQYDT